MESLKAGCNMIIVSVICDNMCNSILNTTLQLVLVKT